jgi:hypothetical protein
MAQLMLINPAKRPSKRRKATPAQLRALAKARRVRAGVSSNPSPRRRRRSLRAVSRTTRRRARRNPIGMTGIMGNIMNAVQGAGGALAVNAVFNMLPLPVTMKTGLAVPAVKMALAVGVGMFAKPLLGRAAGKMAEGAMTVAAYEAIQGVLPISMGGSSVAGLGYMSPGMTAGSTGAIPNMSMPSMAGMGEYVSGMGEYVYQ